MEKVKVTRYKPGRRPDYAPNSSSQDEAPSHEAEKEEEEPVDVPQPLLEYRSADVMLNDGK